MKLVELLAKELSEWPSKAGFATQDKDGEVRFMGGCGTGHDFYLGILADYDDSTVKYGGMRYAGEVTESQWQAERDRQKGSGSHRFKQGDSVKVIASGETEWCRVGDIHKIRVCKTCPDGELVYVVNDDHESCWIREYNLELVARSSDKSGEWKRHRGGDKPKSVSDSDMVEVRLRCGDTQTAYAGNFLWNYADCDESVNITKYRVISQPQAEEVEVNAFVGKDVKIEYAYAQEGVEPEHLEWKTMGTAKIDSICDLGSTEAKTDQIDGPIKWRDTVNELDAYIEEFTREREALINRLAMEGFALLPAMTPVMGVAPFSLPFAEWKAGDLVTSKADYSNQFTKGKKYKVTRTDMSLGEKLVSVESDDKGKANGWLANQFEFHSRP